MHKNVLLPSLCCIHDDDYYWIFKRLLLLLAPYFLEGASGESMHNIMWIVYLNNACTVCALYF